MEKELSDLEGNLLELSEENAELLEQIKAITTDKEDLLKNVRLLEDELELEKQAKTHSFTST